MGVTALMVGTVRPHMDMEIRPMVVMDMEVRHMAVMDMEVHIDMAAIAHLTDMAVVVHLTDMEAHRDMEVLNDMAVIVHLPDMEVPTGMGGTGTSTRCTTWSQRRRAWAWEVWHLLVCIQCSLPGSSY